MSSRPYGNLKPEFLPARIVEFFERNPNEELTHDDACVKFGCDMKQLTNALIRLHSLKRVESVRLVRRFVS